MIHLLVRSADGRPDEILGVVTDAQTLATLQHDGDAMPVGGTLYAVSEYAEDVDENGAPFYAVNRDGLFVSARPFVLAEHDAAQAAKDAAVESLAPEMRAALFPGHVSEADRKAKRAADRAEAEARAAEAKAKREADAKAAQDAFAAAVRAEAKKLVDEQAAAKAKP